LGKVSGIQMKESFEELCEIYSIVNPMKGNNSKTDILKEIEEFGKEITAITDFEKVKILIRKSLTNLEF
jgi:hypothetical protein